MYIGSMTITLNESGLKGTASISPHGKIWGLQPRTLWRAELAQDLILDPAELRWFCEELRGGARRLAADLEIGLGTPPLF